MKSKLLMLPLALALVGAGCFSSEPVQPTQPQEPTKPEAVQPAPSPTVPSEPAPTGTPTTPSPLPVIDATWKTYTNAALGFSFKYPTRGLYAPTWGVTFIKSMDPALKEGCYQPEGSPRQNKGDLQVGDTTFCVTRFEEGAAGQRYETDYYVGGLKGSTILITFSKKLSNGDNFDDVRCHGQLVLATGTSCTPFDLGVYNAHLDQIVGTYTHE